jgi:SAM-dependent methyltransferase
MVTETDVIMAYRLFLGREPENREVVEGKVNGLPTLAALRLEFLNSAEFREVIQLAPAREDHPGCKPLDWPAAKVEVEVSSEILQRMIRRIQSEFLEMGASEPHWSVLTSDRFLAANLAQNEAQFFDSGRESVDDMFAAAARSGLDLPTDGACFELGCGVGRSTIWLARRFGQVIGADVSHHHLSIARQSANNAGLANVTLVSISDITEFAALPDFDLFFSLIVLQHNPPPLMAHILETILSRLTPGGVAYFQIPSHLTSYRFRAVEYLETPPMVGNAEVHCLPQPVLFNIINRAGCDIVEIREDGSLGPNAISHRVLLSKRQKA